MYIKVTNGVPEKYSLGELRRDNPQVSFPETIPESTLAQFDVFPVQPTEPPNYSPNEVYETMGFILLPTGKWAQAWSVRPLTEQELADRALRRDEACRQRYAQESDPLFFKWQRGEATKEQWLDKVAEIKASLEQGGV